MGLSGALALGWSEPRTGQQILGECRAQQARGNPAQSVHARACVALADPVTQPEALYAGLRLVALDGGHFDLADERDNRAADFTPTMVPPMNVR